MVGLSDSRARELLASVKEPAACSCDSCKDMCKRPCWPLPEEAEALIAAGYGDKLMYDYWAGDSELNTYDLGEGETGNGDIGLLCPAEPGREGRRTSFLPHGGCVLQNEAGLCVLHDLKLKPIEGRLARCLSDKADDILDVNVHKCVAATWDTPKGQAIVSRWRNR